MNFFAMQVMSGREDAFIELLKKTLPDQAIYNIKKKMPTRKMGKAINQVSCIFPGYLFFQFPEERLSAQLVSILRKTRHFMRILPANDNIKPLDDRDAEIIRQLLSFGREIGPSLVTFDEKKRIKVIKGPLMGLEGCIVKVNKRKRRAKIRLDMNDSPILFDLSFEILESLKEPSP